MADGKFTQDLGKTLGELFSKANLRWSSKTKFKPSAGEWILFAKSAPSIRVLKARVKAVGALGIRPSDLKDLTIKSASSEVLGFLKELEELVQKHKDQIFTDPEKVQEISSAEITEELDEDYMRKLPITFMKNLPIFIKHYKYCLPKVASIQELSILLRKFGYIWKFNAMKGMDEIKTFLITPPIPPLFSVRPVVQMFKILELVRDVLSTPYGLQGGNVTQLLKDLVEAKILSKSIEEVAEHLVKLATDKDLKTYSAMVASGEEEKIRPMYSEEAFSKAVSQKAQSPQRKSMQNGAPTREELSELVAYLKIPYSCNLFHRNLDLSSSQTLLAISALMKRSGGSMRHLIVALGILQTTDVRVGGFGELHEMVDNSQVQLFKEKVKGELNALVHTAAAMSAKEKKHAGEGPGSGGEEADLDSIDPEKEFPPVSIEVPRNPECELWNVAHREKDNKMYYWHSETNKTKWKKPKCLRERDAAVAAREEAVKQREEKIAARKEEIARLKEELVKRKKEEDERAAKELEELQQRLQIDDKSVDDIIYAGRLRTAAILPALQDPELAKKPSKESWLSIIEERVQKLFLSEREAFRKVCEFFKSKTLFSKERKIAVPKIYRLIRAGLYTEYGLGGGSVLELLEDLHKQKKLYLKFGDLVAAVKNLAIAKLSKDKAAKTTAVLNDPERRDSDINMDVGPDFEGGDGEVMTIGGGGEGNGDGEMLSFGPGRASNDEEIVLTIGGGGGSNGAPGGGDDGDTLFTLGGNNANAGDEDTLVLGGGPKTDDGLNSNSNSHSNQRKHQTPPAVAADGGDSKRASAGNAKSVEQQQQQVPSSTGAKAAGSMDSKSSSSNRGGRKKRASTAGRRTTTRMNKRKIKWKKVKELGRGAFGVVIWGIDTRTGQSIAIKQIRLKSKQDFEKAKEVEHEVNTLKKLSHPNIVELYAVERDGKKLNIIMEYVPSNSIDWVVKKIGKLDDEYMYKVTAQILLALVYCHENGLIHRDIKGKNILVDNYGNVRLADFGSALLASDSEMQKENAEYTPLWAAPEMVKGDGKYTTKVDIWSLGCTIVEMASGKEPWSECNFANPFMALYSIGSTDKIPKIPETMSKEGFDFTMRCLTRDPSLRPSAKELQKHKWVKDALKVTDSDDEKEEEEEDDDEDPFLKAK